MKKIILLCILVTFIGSIFAQKDANGKNDVISFSKNIQFVEAVKVFKELYKEKKDTVLLDFSGHNAPIDIEINQLHWEVAFNSILAQNGLILDVIDEASVIRKAPQRVEEEKKILEEKVSTENDEVIIEITFFEADQGALKEVGIDWSTLVDGEVKINANAKNASFVTEDLFNVTMGHTFDAGDYTVDLNTIFKIFESKNAGHIIARPQVTVQSGESGNVQDGIDFSIKTMDEAGNVTDKFYKSGIVVEVAPIVKEEDGKKFIHLEVSAEKSSARPDPVSTQVLISSVKTKKILFNGEETVIGGLTSKEETSVRKGIPFLKDLPWWVLGIKYFTGYNSKSVKFKELIILIKATVLNSAHDRFDTKSNYELEVKELRRGLPSTEHRLLKQE
ncbi:MAG: hypothetical protein PHR06_12640 [Candidatus Cloacimonetes bacterium]|nr:hypothetical protein [Candidatus Cloacimonadota bacterium]